MDYSKQKQIVEEVRLQFDRGLSEELVKRYLIDEGVSPIKQNTILLKVRGAFVEQYYNKFKVWAQEENSAGSIFKELDTLDRDYADKIQDALLKKFKSEIKSTIIKEIIPGNTQSYQSIMNEYKNGLIEEQDIEDWIYERLKTKREHDIRNRRNKYYGGWISLILGLALSVFLYGMPGNSFFFHFLIAAGWAISGLITIFHAKANRPVELPNRHEFYAKH
jgi:hypothetical protein